MKTLLLKSDVYSDIEIAKKLLASGEVVSLPTETVYGLAADAFNPVAINKIFSAKNRPANHPLILHIYDFKYMSILGVLDEVSLLLANSFWPGPLTILLPKKNLVLSEVTGSSSLVALRMPKNNIMLDIMRDLDMVLAAPSANRHKKVSPSKAEHVISELDGNISAVLDGGPCSFGLESTIVKVVSGEVHILRHGPIGEDDFKALGLNVRMPKYDGNLPGNMLAHYQPDIKSRLVSSEEISSYDGGRNIALIHFSFFYDLDKFSYVFKMPSNRSSYGQKMYDVMHQANKLDADELWIEKPDDSWYEILDRLLKAVY